MSRTFISIIAAATLIITSFNAAPARASEADIAKIIVGSAILLMIGKAINQRQDADRSRERRRLSVSPPRPDVDPHKKHRPHHWTVPPVNRAKILPPVCLRDYRTSEGKKKFAAPECLKDKYRHARRLPKRCENRVWTDQGVRRLYAPRCLRDEGYRFSAR